MVWYKCFTSTGWQLVEGDRRLGIQSVRSLWTGVSSTTIYLCRCPRLENRLHPRSVREPQLQPTQDLGGNSGLQLLQGSFGGMRPVQATPEVGGVEVRIYCGVMTRVCLGSAKYTFRPHCWRQREVRITLCFWELELGTRICSSSWAWWDEVPDLVLASVCDPTKLDGVNCELVCIRLF